MATFVYAMYDDVWNHYFYARIIKFLGSAETEAANVPVEGGVDFFGKLEAIHKHKKKLVAFIFYVARTILPMFSRKSDAFVINSSLPIRQEVLLQLSLRQFPQIWQGPEHVSVAVDSGIRGRFSISTGGHAGFEKFIRLAVREFIPTCYLEGYTKLCSQVKTLPWPKRPKFIYATHNFIYDDVFKAWAALQTEQGTPYFTGQHGNNYGTLVDSPTWPEVVTCDKFFTWGWSNGSPKNVPAYVFKVADRKPQSQVSEGGILMLVLSPPIRSEPEDNYYLFGVAQEEQFRFVAALPEHIHRQLTVRTKPDIGDVIWSQAQRWRDRSPGTRLELGVANIFEITAQHRLVIYAYDSTGILESLALNIPTLCFWHGGFEHLLPSAKPYYELLKEVGILSLTPEEAAERVSLYWDNVGEWWNSKKVQDARFQFCEQYARRVDNPIVTLTNLLTFHANEQREGK
jgi:putative transferase (TIGR04331 family)